MKTLHDKFIRRYYSDFCSMPCSKMRVTFTSFVIDTENNPKNEASVKLYYQSLVSVQKSTLRYTFLSLVAEVGGYLGLLLGMSLFDIYKVIEFLLQRIINKS